MNKTIRIILSVFFASLFSFVIVQAAISPCPIDNSQIFVAQGSGSSSDLYYRLYPGKEITYPDFLLSNRQFSSTNTLLKEGDELCLKNLPAESQKYETQSGDNLWFLWQRIGAVRGYTFREFVYSNYNAKSLTLAPDFDPYHESVVYKDNLGDTIPMFVLDKKVNQSYHEKLIDNNNLVIDAMNNLDTAKIQYLGGDISAIVSSLQDLSDELSYYETQGLQVKILIVDRALTDDSSMTISSLSNLAYQKMFNLETAGNSENILILIMRDTAVTISYPRTTTLLNGNPQFFDKLISKATSDILIGTDIDSVVREMSMAIFLQMSKESI